MYGTVARMKIKPGAWEALRSFSEKESNLKIKGYMAQYVYRMDSNPQEAYLAVIFDSKQSYIANAESPEQDARFREMMQYLEAEPEWHDGELVFAHPV